MDAKTFDECKVLASCAIRYQELQRQLASKTMDPDQYLQEVAVIKTELIASYKNENILTEFLTYVKTHDSI